MSKLLPAKYACVGPDCSSSDGLRIYEDGNGFCFSCKSFFNKKQLEEVDVGTKVTPPPKVYVNEKETPQYITNNYRSRGFQERKIPKHICEYYKVLVSYNSDGEINKHFYPYNGGEAYKVRSLPKDFHAIGKVTKYLFGKERFTSGGKRLIICEGEIDTLSVAFASFERYKKYYPVVGVPSSTTLDVLLQSRDWIRSFDEVVVCFDNDEAGKAATKTAARIIGSDKVKIVNLGDMNDANECLLREGAEGLMHRMFDAEPYKPEGIITRDALWDALVNYNNIESHPYSSALAGVNTKLKGKRLGEITLLISGTGCGKSTILREEILNILETTNSKIGVISLEESPAETARKLAGMHLMKNPAKEEIPIDELKVGFDAVFGDDRVILLDHQGSISDNSILDQLEYMALSGCEYLFIDHITILVSEGVENLTGNEAQDRVMNDLLRLVKRYPVWVGLVSHLRKAPSNGKSFEEGKLPSIDDIRGSGSIKQISFDIISFARNLTAETDAERNTILIRVLKARHTGLTGNVPGASYNYDTGRLSPSSRMDDNFEIL